jgi:tetratricopeptide (TPR) repeat protein
VAAAVAGAYWWERQLPRRLEEASARGDLDACLRYSTQLGALSWLGGRIPQEQGNCRRRKAEQLWQQQRWREALQLQLQLVNSPTGSQADRQQLLTWQQQLQQQALALYQEGRLEQALALLAVMGEDRRADGSALGDRLGEAWNRNRLQAERAEKLAGEQRWWEALEALTRIDHPWWKQRTQATREQVRAGISSLEGRERDHDTHGSLPHTVQPDRLDALVQQRIATGMDEWSAFQSACRELGGRVVEAGPETACQR